MGAPEHNSVAMLHAQPEFARVHQIAKAARAQRGMVYLVGAGPGNPELLTLRAFNLLREADAILYDRLVTPEILAYGRPEARCIYVGKETDKHSRTQEEICAMLIELALQGQRVVRLKGGDPFIFGRGGEEIEALAAHGIAFEVVPGVTAACGVAAFAGIPLTHRDYAHACVFVTGHLKDGTMDLDWEALCRPNQTVVVYMGLAGLRVLCQQLMARGVPASMPAAMIQQGTLATQRIVAGTLACLPQRVAAAGLVPPALTIVGEVVKLRDQLNWFEPQAMLNPAYAAAPR